MRYDWRQVLFTDESRFSLECDIICVLVWRAYRPAYHSEGQFECSKVCRRDPEILFIPHVAAVGGFFLLMQCNARLYTSLLVDNLIEAEIIQLMEWLAISNNLNPIGNVWTHSEDALLQNQGLLLLPKI
ncbi:hypothetical protein TNCV_4171411 [Trichonephila clavipes]|nr:hypothetical protein TNCV_4171411 [Trichonephila clavipes]